MKTLVQDVRFSELLDKCSMDLVQVDASWNLLPWVDLDSKCKGGRSSNPSQPIALSPTSSSHRHARPVSSTPKTHLKFHAASACPTTRAVALFMRLASPFRRIIVASTCPCLQDDGKTSNRSSKAPRVDVESVIVID